jgi:hypothetical protein
MPVCLRQRCTRLQVDIAHLADEMAEEIESAEDVTPEMIAAAVKVLPESCAIEYPLGGDEALVTKIYREMARARPGY